MLTIEPGTAAGGVVQLEERLDAVQRADDVDVEGVPELVDRHVAQRGGAQDPGVVHEHVEATVVAAHDARGPGPRLAVGDIQLDLSRCTRNVVDERDVADQHGGAVGHAALGDGRAETPASACHEHDLAVENSHGNIMRNNCRRRQSLVGDFS